MCFSNKAQKLCLRYLANATLTVYASTVHTLFIEGKYLTAQFSEVLEIFFAVGTQAYVSGSTGSKCLCCPYGYHIDLDFVRYCEAVAAGSVGDRPSTERRKKRERRRQCQSMEVLLGLVISGISNYA